MHILDLPRELHRELRELRRRVNITSVFLRKKFFFSCGSDKEDSYVSSRYQGKVYPEVLITFITPVALRGSECIMRKSIRRRLQRSRLRFN